MPSPTINQGNRKPHSRNSLSVQGILTDHTTVTFEYDYLGRRVEKKVARGTTME